MREADHRRARGQRPGRPDRQRGRAVVGWLIALFAASQVGFAGLLECGAAGLRDPEYYDKFARLRARQAESPGRPLWVALGSSRVAMGLRSAVLAGDPAAPLVLNFGLTGGGPLLEHLTLDRLLRAGVRPDIVLLEFWPPYLTPTLYDEGRLDANRLAHADLDVIARFTPDPATFPRQWQAARLTPTASHRVILASRFVPSWLPWNWRLDEHRDLTDDWGWRPSAAGPEGRDMRALRVQAVKEFYAPCLAAGGPRPAAVTAFEELLSLCRRERVPAVLTWLPESSEFRALYPPPTERWAAALFADLGARPGVRRIDARAWVPDEQLRDGFHLLPDGASAFTARLRREVWP
jgi:hypothetical protein